MRERAINHFYTESCFYVPALCVYQTAESRSGVNILSRTSSTYKIKVTVNSKLKEKTQYCFNFSELKRIDFF